MSTGEQQIPPWLQEQLGRLQQAQQSLQSLLAQKQHLEMEQLETEKALEELKKASDDDAVFKHAGSILIKSTKENLIAELEEKKELSKTRSSVLSKQEVRVKENLKELETKINEMVRGAATGQKTTDTKLPQ
ncbi:MAG: prefoldin subunit beta [Thaumarchaeota archaeon]|nr:MAG: Prefoldin subunit beta [Nitrosopumilales archaeon]MCZ6581920.1 prefoldin subunit beta [Nitrososphaerota archaeon]